MNELIGAFYITRTSNGLKNNEVSRLLRLFKTDLYITPFSFEAITIRQEKFYIYGFIQKETEVAKYQERLKEEIARQLMDPLEKPCLFEFKEDNRVYEFVLLLRNHIYNPRLVNIRIQGVEYESISAALRSFNITPSAFRAYKKKYGLTTEEAIEQILKRDN